MNKQSSLKPGILTPSHLNGGSLNYLKKTPTSTSNHYHHHNNGNNSSKNKKSTINLTTKPMKVLT